MNAAVRTDEPVNHGLYTRWHYTISAEDDERLRELAARRQGIKQRYGVQTRKVKEGYDDWQTHYQWCCAAWSVCHLLDVPMNWTVAAGGDKSRKPLALAFQHSAPLSIDVRYRARQGWSFALMSPDPAGFKADIGIAVYGCDVMWYPLRTYYVHGWFSRSGLRAKGRVEDYSYGPRWVMPYERMAGMDALSTYLDALRRCDQLHEQAESYEMAGVR